MSDADYSRCLRRAEAELASARTAWRAEQPIVARAHVYRAQSILHTMRAVRSAEAVLRVLPAKARMIDRAPHAMQAATLTAHLSTV